MKSNAVAIILLVIAINPVTAQEVSVNKGIELMMMGGEYENVIDTCRQILTYDSLNPEIHYKMGIAYQNILKEDSALNSFFQAVKLNPENKVYHFMLAKGYYNKDKFSLAEPLLKDLCTIDSMNWVYAYYLTGIFMQSYRFDDAIHIYERFLKKDSVNYIYLDKLAFAYLKKEDFARSMELYSKSLSVNNKDVTAIKNLAYLYSESNNSDTAIRFLTDGIKIDSTDLDLYLSRAALYYSGHNTKRALDDYMVILSSGDSSKIYLKRIGICYCNNFQPEEAIHYLMKAYVKDSSDYETCSYLGQSYYKLRYMKNSIYYYGREIEILTPVKTQLGLTYILCGESQKDNGMYQEAIASYKKGQSLKPDINIYLIIANLYDEKLKDKGKAIFYYQKFLDNVRNATMNFTPEYVENIRKRMVYLKTDPSL
jgi:tetratricopeptide (TPR) repeat protein